VTSAAVDFLSTPLQFLKGVGPRKAADLKRAGLVLVQDLLYRLPFRYEDRSRMQPIATLRPGNKAAVLGEIKSSNVAVTRRRGFKIFHAVIADASGSIRCTWMNQAFLADIYDVLISNPNRWKNTVMIVFYDEHGGFFDHVPPLDIQTEAAGHLFATTGVRIPGFVVSPHVAAGVPFKYG